MTYSLEDIELMITNLPKHRALSSLDESFTPQRKHIKTGGLHLPILTRPRKIVNCLTEHFQNNLIISSSWINSGIPYFMWDIRPFRRDKDVRNLLEIPNIELVRSGQMN